MYCIYFHIWNNCPCFYCWF